MCREISLISCFKSLYFHCTSIRRTIRWNRDITGKNQDISAPRKKFHDLPFLLLLYTCLYFSLSFSLCMSVSDSLILADSFWSGFIIYRSAFTCLKLTCEVVAYETLVTGVECPDFYNRRVRYNSVLLSSFPYPKKKKNHNQILFMFLILL